MEKLGTNYGGWLVPRNIELHANSIVYSGGVGEDISFDLKLHDKYGCHIVLIDPTEKAVKHFEEVKEYYYNSKKFEGNIQPDYYQNIQSLKSNFDKFNYLNIGMWNKKDSLKFYKQTNPDYVSQSLIGNMFGEAYDIVEVDSIKNIMQEQKHERIDLLKLDIEGAENIVLNQMLNDKIYPKYLCIEFDLLLKNKDPHQTTRQIVDRLIKEGYKILINDNLNITFKYNI